MADQIKIGIQADVSGAETSTRRVDALRKSADAASVALSKLKRTDVCVDTGRATSSLNEAKDAAEQLEDALSDASKHGVDIDTRSVRRSLRELGDEIKRTGKELRSMGGGRAGGGQFSAKGIGRFAGAAGGALAGMVTGGGGMFSMMGAGLGGIAGAIPGVGMVMGPMIGALAGKIGGALDAAMGDAIKEGMDTSNLRKALGQTAKEFENVRSQTRFAIKGLGIGDTEGAAMRLQYARTAGSAGANEFGFAAGYSRGYGGDPSSSASFFSNMRRLGITDDDKSVRKLGLNIAEAVQRGGMPAKTDELLHTVESFAQTAASITLSRSNISGYAGALTSGMAMKQPGMDLGNTASILSSADASFRHGGGFGDASQIAIMSALSNAGGGMNVFDVKTLMQHGMFGSRSEAFGDGSMAARWASDNNNGPMSARYKRLAGGSGANKLSGQALLEFLKQNSDGDDSYISNISNALTGGNLDQARAVDSLMRTPKGLGSLQGRLSKLGVNLDGIGAQSMGPLAEIFSGNDGTLSKYKGMLNSSESASVGDASGESLRDALLKVFSSKDRQLDTGERANAAQVDLKNIFQEFAGKAIPLTTLIKDGIIALVNKFTPDSPFAHQMKAESTMAKTASADATNGQKTLDQVNDELKQPMGDWQRQKLMQRKADLEASVAGKKRLSNVTPEMLAQWRSTDDELGLPAGVTRSVAAVESGGKNRAKSRAGAQGMFQLMPDTIKALADPSRLGRTLDPNNEADSLEGYKYLMRENLTRYKGNIPKALKAYNAGWDEKKWNNSETEAYVPKIEAELGGSLADTYSERAPAESRDARTAAQQPVKVSGAVDVNLNFPGGGQQTVRAPLSASMRGAPVPAGAN